MVHFSKTRFKLQLQLTVVRIYLQVSVVSGLVTYHAFIVLCDVVLGVDSLCDADLALWVLVK